MSFDVAIFAIKKFEVH